MPQPLFLDHAACCRSVLAQYLYEDLCPGTYALAAGVEAGDAINDNALQMLRHWGIDASNHEPRQIDRSLCNQADGIFAMGPEYLAKLFKNFGWPLAKKSYLFADPFGLPQSFANAQYLVRDPSFDHSPLPDLIKEFAWFRERVVQIHEALAGGEKRLVPATEYLDLLPLVSL
jgi:protein-tyrosine-phosphatase